MKKQILVAIFFIIQLSFAQQTIIGKWKTIDDETGNARSIVEIFEKNGVYYGKIVELLENEIKHKKCEKCLAENKNKPLLGLQIINNLKKVGNGYENGTILDPKTGKTYSCKITFKDKNKIVVRGFLGVSLFGRSQTWLREN